eukprot:TRINITY_DN810_c0_g2_i3.p1 TRINITY_DN810_c0_g2~~TRINITY_DN810_c0_g2_i3.p1  ORF type:complete len:131 (-),score=27.03 TRINITY_DN810_c0_g2_i3:14-406(-)
MGICSSSSIEGKSQSDAIDRELKESKAEMDEEVKLLLLGAGESGKSTIVKQMKIIAQDGYKSDADRAKFKDVIYSNTMQSMKVLVKACQRLGIPLAEESNQVRTALFPSPFRCLFPSPIWARSELDNAHG